MKNLNLKKNQVVIFVIALMLVTAGYLNFNNKKGAEDDLIPTSSLADSEQMAAIGDAKLVSANEITNDLTANLEQSAEQNNNGANSSSTNTIENSINNSEDVTNSNDYFAQSKLDRDSMYSQMLENYQKVLETDNLGADEKTLAQEEIKNINDEKNAIMIAENLIKTKGFEDVILFVNNGNVSVIVKAESLDENQVAQIQNIITRELNVKVSKINVSNQK